MGEAARSRVPVGNARRLPHSQRGKKAPRTVSQVSGENMFLPPPFISTVDACKYHVKSCATNDDSSFFHQ